MVILEPTIKKMLIFRYDLKTHLTNNRIHPTLLVNTIKID